MNGIRAIPLRSCRFSCAIHRENEEKRYCYSAAQSLVIKRVVAYFGWFRSGIYRSWGPQHAAISFARRCLPRFAWRHLRDRVVVGPQVRE
jgi:hypothetical protein